MNSQVTTAPSVGRGYLWAGIVLPVLAIGLGVGQYALQRLHVPWQVPIVTTLGVLLLLVSVAKRFTITRSIVLVLVAALAGLQWFFVTSMSKLPEYAGPARSGQKIPAFQTTRADGHTFSDGDLSDGTAHVLTFFRGRW